MKEQPGQKSRVSPIQADLTKKDENLTKEKILDLTSKHLAKRLEIPVERRSALE